MPIRACKSGFSLSARLIFERAFDLRFCPVIGVIHVAVLTNVLTLLPAGTEFTYENGEGGIQTLGVIPLFVVLRFSQQFSRIVVRYAVSTGGTMYLAFRS